nr:phospholipase-like protein [Tanacetum cinerariifolium]
HIELWVNYMWHVRPDEADWVMLGAYFVQLILQDSISMWYANGNRYKFAWRDVDQIIVVLNLQINNLPSLLVP